MKRAVASLLVLLALVNASSAADAPKAPTLPPDRLASYVVFSFSPAKFQQACLVVFLDHRYHYEESGLSFPDRREFVLATDGTLTDAAYDGFVTALSNDALLARETGPMRGYAVAEKTPMTILLTNIGGQTRMWQFSNSQQFGAKPQDGRKELKPVEDWAKVNLSGLTLVKLKKPTDYCPAPKNR